MNPAAPTVFPSMLNALAQEVEVLRGELHHARLLRHTERQARSFWARWMPSAHQKHLDHIEQRVVSLRTSLSDRIRTGLLVGVEEWAQTSFTPEQMLAWRSQDATVQHAVLLLRSAHAQLNACRKATSALFDSIGLCQRQCSQQSEALFPMGGEEATSSLLAAIKALHVFADVLPEGGMKQGAQDWATGFPAFDGLQEAVSHCRLIHQQMLPVLAQLQHKVCDLTEMHREAMAGKAVMEAGVFVKVQDAMPAVLLACERHPDAFWDALPETGQRQDLSAAHTVD